MMPEDGARRRALIDQAGVDEDLVNAVWRVGTPAMLAELEAAGPDDVRLVNELWADLEVRAADPDLWDGDQA